MRPYVAVLCLVAAFLFSNTSSAEDAEQGSTLYRAYCAQCHGLEGDGYGVNALYMAVQPKDHREAKEMRARTDEDLFTAIKFGGSAVSKSVLMPAWENNLDDDEIHALVAYLRQLSGTGD